MEESELFKQNSKESNPQRLKESIGRIGLFWFSKDYSEIIRSEGEREISNSDILKSERMDPVGLHAEYDMPRDTPRGRICYEGRYFIIWVGEDCPLENETLIGIIKKYYDLIKMDSNAFKVKKHYHWNTKT